MYNMFNHLLTTTFIFIALHIRNSNQKYPDNKTEPEYLYNFTTLPFINASQDYIDKGQYHAFPQAIRVSPNGELFISVPRHIFPNDIASSIPGTINKIYNNTLIPWPTLESNDYINGDIKSVVGFEIDLEGRLWLLNHSKDKREILVYNKKGQKVKAFDLSSATTHKEHTSYLTTIRLDMKNKYAYITDTGRLLNDTQQMNTKSNLIVVNLETELSIKILQKDISTKPNFNYNNTIKNIGLYGLALSCDKSTLYYSPLKSNEIFSLQTSKLRDQHIIRGDIDIHKSNKSVASFEMILSARGIFYYTAIEDNGIYVNFYESEYKFEPKTLRRIGHDSNKHNDTINEIPTSLTFNSTTGYLLYLVNRYQYFMTDVNQRIDPNKINFQIMNVYVNDRSYLYPCNLLYYMDNYLLVIIVMVALSISYGIIYIIRFVSKIDKEEKSNKEEHGQELLMLSGKFN